MDGYGHVSHQIMQLIKNPGEKFSMLQFGRIQKNLITSCVLPSLTTFDKVQSKKG